MVLGTIGVPFAWWRDSAARLEAAGYAGVWCWDHFTSRGSTPKGVLEAWTTLSGAAAATSRIGIGTLVANVMNHHPAVIARMASTLQDLSAGRFVLGIGIGGHAAEHEAYGIPFPDVPERVARLEEGIAIIRALWTGERVSRGGTFYPLQDAIALPPPDPPPPIIVGGQSARGARLAARLGDGWTTRPDLLDRLRPTFEEELRATGRQRADAFVLVAWEGGRAGEDALVDGPWISEPGEELGRWRERGADAVAIMARTTRDVDALVEAARRW